MSEQNTAWLLREWANWISDGSGIDLRVKGCLGRVVPSSADERGVDRPAVLICDDQALRVDRAMAKLNLISPQFHKCLFLTFCFDYSDRRLAAYFGISRWSAVSLYTDSYEWMDRELNNQMQSAA